MNLTLLIIMVLVQIVAFQYGATQIVRTAANLPTDDKAVAGEVRERILRLHHQVRRSEFLLGGILLVALILVVVVLPMSYHPRKIALAVISLTSTAGLLIGYMATYRDLFDLANRLPDPSRRVAGLSPRKLGAYYPLWREVLPWGVIAATLASTVVFANRSGASVGLGELKAWGTPILQIALNVGLLMLARARVRSHYCLPLGRKIWADQEEFLQLEDRIRRIETRAALWSRVWIMILCGVVQLRVLDAVPWARSGVHVVSAGLLVHFLLHVTRMARYRRTLQAMPESVVGSKGGLS
jgi:predicted nucleic acid-binding Zn ribbon protein